MSCDVKLRRELLPRAIVAAKAVQEGMKQPTFLMNTLPDIVDRDTNNSSVASFGTVYKLLA